VLLQSHLLAAEAVDLAEHCPATAALIQHPWSCPATLQKKVLRGVQWPSHPSCKPERGSVGDIQGWLLMRKELELLGCLLRTAVRFTGRCSYQRPAPV